MAELVGVDLFGQAFGDRILGQLRDIVSLPHHVLDLSAGRPGAAPGIDVDGAQVPGDDSLVQCGCHERADADLEPVATL